MKQAEIELGIIALDVKIYEGKEPSAEDVLRLFDLDPAVFLGISYFDRVEFLSANGYEISRENLVNANLPSNQSSSLGNIL